MAKIGASVAPGELDAALELVRDGACLAVPTYTHCTIIDKQVLERFKAAGFDFLKEEGRGYRMRQGRGSVYLFPGQVRYIIED